MTTLAIAEKKLQDMRYLDIDVDRTLDLFEEIEKLIEYNPSETKYYGLLADLYQSQGDSENALKYYRKILSVNMLLVTWFPPVL